MKTVCRVPLCSVTISPVSRYSWYAECRYTECRGARTLDVQRPTVINAFEKDDWAGIHTLFLKIILATIHGFLRSIFTASL